MRTFSFLLIIALGFSINTKAQILTDSRDGKVYKTVQIGNQTWTAENLNYTTSGSYCYEGREYNCDQFGRLYSWESANSACPSGWHLPTNSEWQTLVDQLGGDVVAGGKLKAIIGWNSPNAMADNSSGFRAYSGGVFTGSKYALMGDYGYWWTSDENGAANGFLRTMDRENGGVGGADFDKAFCFSVRCVKD